jgi:hypothetical protein
LGHSQLQVHHGCPGGDGVVVWGTPGGRCTFAVPAANRVVVWGTPGGTCTLAVPAANGVVDM